MKTTAAVVYEPGKKIEIEELNLDGPEAGEVLIRYTHAGLCHSDLHVQTGDLEARLPMVLGHEGAGIVEEVGPGVASLRPGDHVIPLYIPECRECEFCLSGKTNLCGRLRETQSLGLMPDLTDERAAKWWTDKRRYLVEEIGVDGFKTDGGEHAWGRDVRYLDGRHGDEVNGLFPMFYAKAYGDLLRSAGKAPVTFSRAGFLTLCAIALVGLLQVVSYFVAGSAISGMTAIIVTQLQVAPLRPVQLRTVFAVLKRHWRPFLNTSIRLALRIMIGYVLLIIPGLVMQVRYVLWAPVVLMEGLSKKAALKRARFTLPLAVM